MNKLLFKPTAGLSHHSNDAQLCVTRQFSWQFCFQAGLWCVKVVTTWHPPAPVDWFLIFDLSPAQPRKSSAGRKRRLSLTKSGRKHRLNLTKSGRKHRLCLAQSGERKRKQNKKHRLSLTQPKRKQVKSDSGRKHRLRLTQPGRKHRLSLTQSGRKHRLSLSQLGWNHRLSLTQWSRYRPYCMFEVNFIYTEDEVERTEKA